MKTIPSDPLAGPMYESALDIALIAPNPDNPRKDLGDLTELAASISEQGIIEPLVVEATEEGAETYVLLAGHRRLAAAHKAGLTHVPALIHEEPSPRHVRIQRMLTENLQREDLTAVEEGDAFQMLLELPDAALDAGTLAKSLGRTKKYVTERVKAAGLPEATRERIIRGQVTLTDAARIEAFAKDKDALKRINKAAEAGPIALDRALEEEKSAADAARARAKLRRELRAKGRRVVDETSDEWHEGTYLAGIYRDVTLGGIDAEEEHHFAEHPSAHLVAVTDNFGRGTRMSAKCSRPEWHTDNPTEQPGESGEERAERLAAEKQRAEAERVEAERSRKLAAAAVARRHYLGQVATSPSAGKLAHEIALGALNPVFPSEADTYAVATFRAFAQILLPNLSDQALDDVAGLKKKVRASLERCTVEQLVVLNDIRLNLGRDEAFTRTSQWSWDPTQTHQHAWRKRLNDFYGYEDADIETEMYALLASDGGEQA